MCLILIELDSVMTANGYLILKIGILFCYSLVYAKLCGSYGLTYCRNFVYAKLCGSYLDESWCVMYTMWEMYPLVSSLCTSKIDAVHGYGEKWTWHEYLEFQIRYSKSLAYQQMHIWPEHTEKQCLLNVTLYYSKSKCLPLHTKTYNISW